MTEKPVVPRLSKQTYGKLTGMTYDLATACIERGLIKLVDNQENSEGNPC